MNYENYSFVIEEYTQTNDMLYSTSVVLSTLKEAEDYAMDNISSLDHFCKILCGESMTVIAIVDNEAIIYIDAVSYLTKQALPF